MKPDPVAARQILLNAQRALQAGDRKTARRMAEQAAALAPGLEDPWLILAGLASPRASVAYLQQALKINPHSERARKGMHWAADRLRHERVTAQTQPQHARRPNPGQREISSPVIRKEGQPARVEPKTQPRVQRPLPTAVARSTAGIRPLGPRSLAKYRWSFIALAALLLCSTLAWAFLPGNASPVLAFLHVPLSTPFSGILAGVGKPTYTPTFTATFTPTSTSTPTPTSTPTFTPTSTPTLTWTPLPTDTPIPTDTPLPTDTPIPWPTDTSISYSSGGGEHWIDVDLSDQMLYAYEGNTIVASFLVSTGVPAFPTVTGQYHIYIKLVSTLMVGDNYYLPDVPYTMYFYKGYGIHGTYWHNNFGHPMSHGCVNMYTPDAEWLFYWAPMGALVNIHW